jgi:hypothetical protein
MDNQPNFAERAKLMRETAYKLRDASEVVLAEGQHMEASVARFKERIERRNEGRGTTNATR